MTVQPELLVSFCKCYDLKDHATNIFQDIINSLGAYVQSLLVSQQHVGINGEFDLRKCLKFNFKFYFIYRCLIFNNTRCLFYENTKHIIAMGHKYSAD